MNRTCEICGNTKSLEEFEKICNGHAKYCKACGELYIEDLFNNSTLNDNTFKYFSRYITRFNYFSKKRIETGIQVHSRDKTEPHIEKITITDLMIMLETFNYQCIFSNKKLQLKDFSLDHIDELALSRNHSLYNLAPACRDINKIAGSAHLTGLWISEEDIEKVTRKYGKEYFYEFYDNKNWITSLWIQGIHEIPKEKTTQEPKQEPKEVQKVLWKPEPKKKGRFKWHTNY
ncbi:HNH endonuclease [Terrisporobacter glycolicus]|uniref:HNH endonuclease n=1 Tax=Terrisporobacter glycolicus TaxID=36841 RepID=UPI003464CD9C